MQSQPKVARLLVAPGAATRLAAAADWVRAHSQAAEILILAPTQEAGDDLARRVTSGEAARFGLVRLTLARLAGRLAMPALARERRVPASSLSRTAVVARVVHELRVQAALGRFAPVARCPGFAHTVARTLEELRMSALDAPALARLEDVSPDLALLMSRVEEELARSRLADRALVFESAIAVVGEEPARNPVNLPLLLLDLPLATMREMELVSALARRAPEVLATAPAGDLRAIGRLERALGCQHEKIEAAGEATGAGTGIAPGFAPGIAPGALASPAASSLSALQAHLFEEDAPAPPRSLDETVTLRSAPGEARECVEIARQIQAEAARGVAWDRIAVFLRSPREYAAHLEEALGRAEIPTHFARGVKRPHPAGRALLVLLECAAERLSARRFAEYLSLAQVPDSLAQVPDSPGPSVTSDTANGARTWTPPDDELLFIPEPGESPAPEAAEPDLTLSDPEAAPIVAGTLRAPWRWEQLLVDSAVIGGDSRRWARRLEGLEAEMRLRRAGLDDADEGRIQGLEKALADLAHLRAFAMPLIDRLAALANLRGSWGMWLAALRELVAAALRRPERVLATLAELEPMAPVGPVDLEEVRLVLGPRLRDLAEPPPHRRYGAVFVGPAEGARGLEFDVVFVPGLAERLFPRKIVEDPILLDVSRKIVANDALEIQAARVESERLELRLAVGAARARVHLSYPRIDVELARPRVPSFYALEALRAAEGELPGFEELAGRAEAAAAARLGWPAPARREDAIDEAEYDLTVLAPLMGSDAEAAAGSARYLLSTNACLARALRARAQRWRPKWTGADGLVKAGAGGLAALSRHQIRARSYSPTALQNFAICPYRFFLQAVHRLEPRQEPAAIETIDPLTRGALVHEVQFELFTRLEQEGLLPLRSNNVERAQVVLDQVLDSVVERYKDELAPAIPRVWDDGVSSIRADLRQWLRLQAKTDDGWVPHRFELSFGLSGHQRRRAHADPGSVADAVPIAGGLLLRGSIDLVERRAGGTLRVTDHKTGKVRVEEGLVVGGGECLQPLFYALACEQVLGAPVEAGRLYFCTADGGYSERVVPLNDESREAGAQVVAIIDRWLQAGFLPAAPRKEGCKYCDYRSVCGPNEELRVGCKPQAELHDLKILRDMR